MKKILPAIAIALLIISCKDKKDEDAIPKNSDWNTQNLKGHVKSYEETSYTPDSTGKIGAMDSCCIDDEQYNEKGYNDSSQTKDSKGTVKSEVSVTHYDGGQTKQIMNTANGKTWTSFDIQIDKDGKYSGAKTYDTTGKLLSFYTDLKEDDYGNVTTGVEHKPDSSIKTSFTAEFNSSGVQTGFEQKDSSGKVNQTYKAELDDKNNVTKSTSTSVTKDSTTTKTRTFKYDSYDDQGNWTQRTTYDEKGKAIKVLKRTYTYYKKD